MPVISINGETLHYERAGAGVRHMTSESAGCPGVVFDAAH